MTVNLTGFINFIMECDIDNFWRGLIFKYLFALFVMFGIMLFLPKSFDTFVITFIATMKMFDVGEIIHDKIFEVEVGE